MIYELYYIWDLCSLQNMYVLLRTYVFEYFWPYGDTDLSKKRRPKQVHIGSRLADASADAQRYLVIEDRLMVSVPA